jgi:hypothetical protein
MPHHSREPALTTPQKRNVLYSPGNRLAAATLRARTPTGTLPGGQHRVSLSLWCGTFVIGQAFPWLLETLRGSGVFLLSALMCVPAILIAWKLLPETKGKTLEEIERFWLQSARPE